MWHSMAGWAYNNGHHEYAPALAVPMVVRETRLLGHCKALRYTLRGKRLSVIEKRDMQ